MISALVWFGLGLTVLGGAVFFISRSAKHKERRKIAEISLNHARKAIEIDEDVGRLSDSDVADGLRGDFRD